MSIRSNPLHMAVAALALTGMGLALGMASWPVASNAQQSGEFSDPTANREALERAQLEAQEAAKRADELTRQAQQASQAAEKTARQSAALAARIQQSEADVAEGEARLALITDQRRELSRKIAVRQQPLARLTGALQNMARRPLALSALRPGSLKDAVYARAVLETTMPQIRQRTAALRGELAQGRALERTAAQTLAQLRGSEDELRSRRRELTALEGRQRRASRQASGIANRENARALVLAEEARDLDTLIDQLGEANSLRRELAQLAGPIIRPERPGASQVITGPSRNPAPRSTDPPAALQLPVQGRILTGFGAVDDAGIRSQGITIAPREQAQVVAPARGRVAFAGPYRGFGRIVIIEHDNGWTSLVTGLGRTAVEAGDELVGGSPLGAAGRSDPVITMELRRDGAPVNPLQFM